MSNGSSMGSGRAGESMGRGRKCTARRSDGGPCGNAPMRGQLVCRKHGGGSPQARAAAERRLAEAEVRVLFEKTFPEVVPIENPLLAYARFAGRVMAWLDLMEQLLSDVESPRYRGATAEQIRGEVVLFERAMDRANTVLGTYAKLNIDERLARVTEQQVTQLVAAVKAALVAAGLSSDVQQRVQVEIARQLRALSASEVGS